MSTNIGESNDVQIPANYIKYHKNISQYIEDSISTAQKAKEQGFDISEKVESQIGYDLPDRIAKIHEIDISNRLRILLPKLGKELTALKISEEIVLGKYGGTTIEEKLNNAVRVGLSVVTEGVTVAPLQGIYDVKIKTNANRTQYLSVSFAGPIRSAGGTEAAVTMLIADHVRKVIGLDKYIANSFDDEISRYVEELRIYEREVGNFQFKVSDKDVIRCIDSLPVEIDGVDTDPVEVIGHRNLQRVATNRVRGGALRVMNDGLIGRSRKLLKIVETLKLEGWDWLKNLEGAIQTPEDDTVSHRMTEVITGRPVLSMQKKIGGFRLRYGRSCNTGFSTIGIHPTIPILLSYAIAVGTQIKIDAPGKASTIALVDSIEPPIVKLSDGTVMKIKTINDAKSVVNRITKILYLGDILISYGDFLENNTQLLPSSYVEEIWALELDDKLNKMDPNSYLTSFETQRLIELTHHPLEKRPSVTEAFKISQHFDIPFYPGYVFYWSALTEDEFRSLIINLLEHKEIIENSNEMLFSNDSRIKEIFEKLGISHSLCLDNTKIRIDDPDQLYILTMLTARCQDYGSDLDIFLRSTSTTPSDFDPNYIKTHILDRVSTLLKVSIKEKFSSSIAVRVGRPEKAADRKMKPPVHVLFPIGTNGGPTRDILKAMQKPLYIEIANRVCIKCKLPSISVCCRDCSSNTPIRIMCSSCKYEVNGNESIDVCPVCGNRLKTHSPTSYPLKIAVEKAKKHLSIQPIEPLKGVKALMGKNRCAEPLEKGILRQKHNLYTFKDGTIRFDATNEPLTHFKPKWIKTDIAKLRTLGYLKDHTGNELESSEQLVELFIQDIIIPIHAAEHLVKIAQFVDEELTRFYGIEAFYKISSIDDLIGHLVVGLAPHTSVGIIGRVIGFVNSQVCLGSPIWHSAKRRDCDGDADSIMLLMDIFLNFSKEYLPDRIGGLMDAPLLIQPLVFPHEVQRQAHNIDVDEKYPLDFYRSSWTMEKTNVIDNIDLVKKRLGQPNQFFDYKFTHFTDNIMLDESHSLYSTLNTMEEKLKMQITTAKLINAVDADEVMAMVLTTHILPDIMGNLRAYSSQSFRCTKCGQKYRRMPLVGKCLECHNELLQTVSRGSVEKYVQTALNICSEFKISEYLTSRIDTLQAELNLLFRQDVKDQHTIIDFI